MKAHWTRTDMFRALEDGSTALFFEKAKVESLPPEELIRTVEESSDLTLPGWEPEKMARIKELFEAYQTVDEKQLWANLEFFLHGILPVAEEHGIQMAIHPDDPPWSIFGLPRIITGGPLVAASTVHWLIDPVTIKSAPSINAAMAASGVPIPPAAPTRTVLPYRYFFIMSSRKRMIAGMRL